MRRWKKVRGFDGYRVSDDGLVESTRDRCGGCTASARVLKPDNSTHGRRVTLTARDGTLKRMLISHLVLRAFVGAPPPGKRLCDHKDLDPSNNSLGNLRWCSALENNRNKPFRCVHLIKGRWCARIRIGNGKRIRIGGFDTFEQAEAAYLSARRQHHGEFTCEL